METVEAAWKWAEALRVGWPRRDLDACLALYADDAIYHLPFGGTRSARDHLREVLALGDVGPTVWFAEPLVKGDRAAIQWWAIFVIDGQPTTFAATDWLRFNDEGLVVEEHSHWMSKSDRLEPWPGWG